MKRTILCLLIWCWILAVWNGFQSYQIDQLKKSLTVTQECLVITQDAVSQLMTNWAGQLKDAQ